MVIRGRAPLRVSFGGGGTDVAPFCEQQGGAIIGSTINKYAYCSIVPREDDQIIVHSLDFDMTVKYNTREKLRLRRTSGPGNCCLKGNGYQTGLRSVFTVRCTSRLWSWNILYSHGGNAYCYGTLERHYVRCICNG